MFYELSQLSVRNLLRARARLIMTAGGVLVGTTAVILLIALTIGLQQVAEGGLGQNAALTEISVYPNFDGGFMFGGVSEDQGEDGPGQLNLETVQQLWALPGVQVVIPIVNLQGGMVRAGDYEGGMWIVGIDPALLPYMGLEAQEGILSLNPGEAIVGAHAADYFSDPELAAEGNFEPVAVDLMAQPSELILYQYTSATPRERDVDLNVVGRLVEGTSSYDYAMLLPMQDVIDMNEWISGNAYDPDTFVFDSLTVRAADREVTNDVADAIRDLGFSAGGMGDFLNDMNAYFRTMRLMLGGIGAVALLVAAFGVANTMTMAILERTKEIGLMKAIGATDRHVMTVFLMEAGLVGLAGGLGGVGLSLALQRLVNQAVQNIPEGGGINFLPIDPSQINGNLIIIPGELIAFGLLLAVGVGVIAGLYPSLRAASLPPVIALKSE
jgi:putative ABC transport system permease protein